MECTCVRLTDLPSTSTLYADLIYHFDRVRDFFPFPPNDPEALLQASRFPFPDDRRAKLVQALKLLNTGNPSLEALAEPGTVAVVTGQQVGLFSGPAYTVYKALTAIRIAEYLNGQGIRAVPVFWLATEDHDFAEVNHVWVFGADQGPVRLRTSEPADNGSHPVGSLPVGDVPLEELRSTLQDLPFADDALALVEGAYRTGATMGSAFAAVLRELFQPFGLLLVDPMTPGLRELAAPLMAEAVSRMPELIDALRVRSKELVARGYHAQVLVDDQTSLVFLLEGGKRLALRHSGEEFSTGKRKLSREELAAKATSLSPNALLRPVMQDYMLPTVAYVGGAAELAYLAQSQVLYRKLLDRQPVAFPRAGFTLLDERSRKRMQRYALGPADLFRLETELREKIASKLVPPSLRGRMEAARNTTNQAIEGLTTELIGFDSSLAKALGTSRRKIEYQMAKIERKTAAQILRRDQQAENDASMLHNLAFPERHLQERLYSIIPFLAKFGPGLLQELHGAVRLECPDHQLLVV